VAWFLHTLVIGTIVAVVRSVGPGFFEGGVGGLAVLKILPFLPMRNEKIKKK
jgi:hypothetical protein